VLNAGLYVCEECDAAFNADVNGHGAGAENIRLDVNQRNSKSPPSVGEERSPGWAGWHSLTSPSMTCPVDSNRRIN
jgi:hypothetical protein